MNIFDMVALYVFVISILFSIKYVFEFIINMKSDNPAQLEITPLNRIFLLGSTAYIITYLITLIFG